MHTYELRIVDDRGNDQREWPSDAQVRECLDVMPDSIAFRAGRLMEREVVMVSLLDHEVVQFHHLRRKFGCCPRIKWSVGGDDQWGTCEMDRC